MRIIIEPSIKGEGYATTTYDTMTNSDNTGDLVNAVLSLLVLQGHHIDNVKSSADQWSNE
jgi:hypothetical protein